MMRLENWTIQQETGYTPITTFYTDFSIADKFGRAAILDTYRKAVEQWKNDYKYMTELAMVLNWKCWRWWEEKRAYGELYRELFIEQDRYCQESLHGEELEYYNTITD